MKYHNSIHFREDPIHEIEAAMVANSTESILGTLMARLSTEEALLPRNEHEIERIQQQLAHLALFNSESEVAA